MLIGEDRVIRLAAIHSGEEPCIEFSVEITARKPTSPTEVKIGSKVSESA